MTKRSARVFRTDLSIMNQRQIREKIVSPLNHWRLINNWFLIEASSPRFFFPTGEKQNWRIELLCLNFEGKIEMRNPTRHCRWENAPRKENRRVPLIFRSFYSFVLLLSAFASRSRSLSFEHHPGKMTSNLDWSITKILNSASVCVRVSSLASSESERDRQAGTAMSLYDVSVLFNFRGKKKRFYKRKKKRLNEKVDQVRSRTWGYHSCVRDEGDQNIYREICSRHRVLIASFGTADRVTFHPYESKCVQN